MAGNQNPNFKDPNLRDPNLKISEEQVSGAADAQANQSAAGRARMPENPPANVERDENVEAGKSTGVIYYPVGTTKFILMCLCLPYHMYEIWWLYKQFVCQKERGGKILSPLWRINMPILYLRSLLEAMRDEGKPYGIEKELPIEKVILYWCMLIVCLLCFPPPYSALGIFSFVPFVFVNKYLIKVNRLAGQDRKIDTKIGPPEFVVILVGGAYFALDIYLKYFWHP